MKRMTENAISYYTVTKDDIKNITPVETNVEFKYTPSEEFIEVLHNFKSVLRVDWNEVAPYIAQSIGASFSILYPVGKTTNIGDAGYAYFGGNLAKPINPIFFEINGEYHIDWDLS